MKNLDMDNKYRIAASILDCDFLNLGSEIKKVRELGIDMLHIDVMDGNFVPNITIGAHVISKIREFTGLLLDVHLMIKNPDRHLDRFIGCGADIISVHVEECPHLSWTLNHLRQHGVRVAVALNPSTPVSSIENVLPYLDMVLIMTVNPGFGGQKFLGEMLQKIRKLKAMLDDYRNTGTDKRNILIQVDGGINQETASEVISAGANVLVMGSAIFKSEDPRKVIKKVGEIMI